MCSGNVCNGISLVYLINLGFHTHVSGCGHGWWSVHHPKLAKVTGIEVNGSACAWLNSFSPTDQKRKCSERSIKWLFDRNLTLLVCAPQWQLILVGEVQFSWSRYRFAVGVHKHVRKRTGKMLFPTKINTTDVPLVKRISDVRTEFSFQCIGITMHHRKCFM